MPTYEYECLKCGKHFDAFQSMKDQAFKTCPQDKCQVSPWGDGEVKRLLGTGAGLIFKGSGFYITDYRSEGYKQSAKKDAGAGESAPSKPAEKSASVPTPPAPPTKSGGTSASSSGASSSAGGGA
ncbi:MAG: FmdB family zinc ribbon protein [Chthoniobacterales bacterium]|jgi:putative FmdB family regulatory protein